MGTISDKLMRIINTKEDIRQALISKGYDVPTSIPFKEYAKMILDLPCKVDSFPDIEGIVARYSASGLTNEQMAANPVWVDKTGNGHDLQLKNFAWKGMSGVGGYTENYDSNKWYKVASRIDITWTYKSFNARSIKDNRFAQLFYQSSLSDTGFRVLSCTIKVSGLTDGQGIEYVSNGARPTVIMRIENDGIYHLPSFDFGAKNAYYGFKFLKLQESCNITIEQLPLYPGALVFDGVDDYGVCDNFPILTKEKGYTVVALRQWITYNPNAISAIATNASDQSFNGAFTFENYNKGAEQTISYGATQITLQYSKSPFSWQTTYKYNGVNIANGNKDATNSLVLGRSYPQRNEFANFAIWELVFLDHDATEEELTKIKDYFVKTYPWLFPDQAWTVTGKTNEDEDRATIANITGNGNDLVLSNFGFAEGSGYGLYAQNYISYAITNRAVYTKTNSSIHVTKSITAGVNFTESARDVTIPSYRIKVTGIQSGQEMIYRGSNNTFLTNIPSDGIYVLPAVENGSNLGFQFVSYTGDCDITIEQIPEYEGYLITDGVDDKVQSYSFTMNEDWTIVGDWELLSNVQINCGIVKAQNVYLYNTANGLLISINNPRSLQSFGTKSLHAICSDGRLYDRNWVEYEYTVDQNFAIVESSLNIGFNLNNYTQIAFKNLGIYNNQILYKDDCIKAYNYLQTLKAK
nr:MAG: hypothetical protein [Bacteriophage sp.]